MMLTQPIMEEVSLMLLLVALMEFSVKELYISFVKSFNGDLVQLKSQFYNESNIRSFCDCRHHWNGLQS
ncbi:hypothetical protein HNY73_002500 [Argiope bruennichi]|uniref:Uncharacterized protein n=1 Tax=Argiope bruennichi TaxID=94029 RepID=A0A8T0FUS9_ARGBR|nr:hypothetical protein HNY73_002500 [Argiope bruennichi]